MHEPSMDETEWVRTNATLIGEMGATSWLRQLLDALEGKAGAQEGPINPFQAVNIDPLFAAEHPPLIEREMWVDVNVMQIRNMGAEGWLRQLLDVLTGDIVTAEEVGFAPPGGTLKSLAFLEQMAHDRKAAIYAAEHDGNMRHFAYHEGLGEC